MDAENPNDSSNADPGRSPFQFSLKSLLLLPLWVAIVLSVLTTFGKAAIPFILGILCGLGGSWISRYFQINRLIPILAYPAFGTLLGVYLVGMTLTIHIKDDWYWDYWLWWTVFPMLFSMLITIIVWYYVRK
jgi:hypothetical protein